MQARKKLEQGLRRLWVKTELLGVPAFVAKPVIFFIQQRSTATRVRAISGTMRILWYVGGSL